MSRQFPTWLVVMLLVALLMQSSSAAAAAPGLAARQAESVAANTPPPTTDGTVPPPLQLTPVSSIIELPAPLPTTNFPANPSSSASPNGHNAH